MNSLKKLRNLALTPSAFLAAIAALALFLRFYRLDLDSFWMDEIATMQMAQRSIPDLVETLRTTDVHPPGHFILIHFWEKIVGTSEFGIRASSAIAGTLTVVTTYALARQMLGQQVGLISAFLLAVSPNAVYYSRENRAYAMMALLSSMTMYYGYAAIRRQRMRHWVGFIACAVIGVYFHYFGALAIGMTLILLVVTLVLGIFPWKQYNLLGLGVSSFLILLCCVPLYSYVLAQYQAHSGGIPHAMPSSLEFFERILAFLSSGSWAMVLFLVPIACELLFGKQKTRFLVLFGAVIAGIGASFVINRISPVVTQRNMIVVLPQYLILTSAAWARWSEHGVALLRRIRSLQAWLETDGGRLVLSLLLSIMLGAAVSLPGFSRVYTVNREDWRGAASYLAANAHDGDIVLVAQFPSWLNFYLEKETRNLLVLDALNLDDSLVSQAPELFRPIDAFWVIFSWTPWDAQELSLALGDGFTVDTRFFGLALVHRRAIDSRHHLLEASAKVLAAIAFTQPDYLFRPLDQAVNLYTAAEHEDLAIEMCLRSSEANLASPFIQLKVGEYHLEKGDTAAAVQAFERVVELEAIGSLAFQAALHLAEYYQGQGEIDTAVYWYTVAAERMQPWASVANAALARLYRDQGRLDEAVQAYLAAVGQPQDPEVVTYYLEMAQIYEEMGRLEDAVHAHQAVLDLQPDNVAVRERLETLEMQEKMALSLPLLEFKGYPEEFQKVAVAHFAESGDFLMAVNGTISSPPGLLNPGVYIVQVVAHGQPALDADPEMTVEVSITDNEGDHRGIAMDAFLVGEQVSFYESSPFELNNQAAVIVSIGFFNDYGAPNGDRNLFIRRVWIASEPPE